MWWGGCGVKGGKGREEGACGGQSPRVEHGAAASARGSGCHPLPTQKPPLAFTNTQIQCIFTTTFLSPWHHQDYVYQHQLNYITLSTYKHPNSRSKKTSVRVKGTNPILTPKRPLEETCLCVYKSHKSRHTFFDQVSGQRPRTIRKPGLCWGQVAQRAT